MEYSYFALLFLAGRVMIGHVRGAFSCRGEGFPGHMFLAAMCPERLGFIL